MSRTALLFGHAGCLNRGCEAILRTTSGMLKEAVPNLNIILASNDLVQDSALQLPAVDHYISHGSYYRKYSPLWWLEQMLARGFGGYLNGGNLGADLGRAIRKADVLVSLGGDNYCGGLPIKLLAIDRAAKKASKLLVHYGSSFEEGMIRKNRAMLNDLKSFDRIVVRESLSHSNLLDCGLVDNVKLGSDPAFTMEKAESDFPPGWQLGDTIGINVSNLIMRYEKHEGVIMRSLIALIKHVLKNSSSGIALIPHVNNYGKHDFDLEPLGALYREFEGTGRVTLIGPDLTSPQTKGLIAGCRMFIGARTHATIAAYSTCVPTLVIGYSVKSRGIARDLFGDEKGLVVPAQDLEDEKQLIHAFEDFREREDQLRTHLERTMPAYTESARASVKHITDLL